MTKWASFVKLNGKWAFEGWIHSNEAKSTIENSLEVDFGVSNVRVIDFMDEVTI